MKLNRYDREAFVNAVLDDVPAIDYNEQCRQKVMAWAIAQMPEDVRAAYAKHPEYIINECICTPSGLSNVHAPHTYVSNLAAKAPELWAELAGLSKADAAQDERRRALSQQLDATIAGCSTLKQAKDRLPEFVKYLPAERDATGVVNLPAVANLVTDLIAAGWPKGKEPAVAEGA